MEVYDWTIPAIIFLALLICCFIMSPIFHVKNSENKIGKTRNAPFEFAKIRKGWLYSGLIALLVEYVLILLSFAATALAVYILVENKELETAKTKIIIYSVLSLKPSLRSNRKCNVLKDSDSVETDAKDGELRIGIK